MPVAETEIATAVAKAALVEDKAKIRLIPTRIGINSTLSRARIAGESFNDYTDIEQIREKILLRLVTASRRELPHNHIRTEKNPEVTGIDPLGERFPPM